MGKAELYEMPKMPRHGYSRNMGKIYTRAEIESLARGMLKAADEINRKRPDTILVPERGSVPLIKMALGGLRLKGVSPTEYSPHIVYFPNTSETLRSNIRTMGKKILRESSPHEYMSISREKIESRIKDLEEGLEDTPSKRKGFGILAEMIGKLIGRGGALPETSQLLRDALEKRKPIPQTVIEQKAREGYAREDFEKANRLLEFFNSHHKQVESMAAEITTNEADRKKVEDAIHRMEISQAEGEESLESYLNSIHEAHLREKAKAVAMLRELNLPKLKNVMLIDEVNTGSALFENYSLLKGILPKDSVLHVLGIAHENGKNIDPEHDLRGEKNVAFVGVDKLVPMDHPDLLGTTYLKDNGELFKYSEKGGALTRDGVPTPPRAYAIYKQFLYDVHRAMKEQLGKGDDDGDLMRLAGYGFLE